VESKRRREDSQEDSLPHTRRPHEANASYERMTEAAEAMVEDGLVAEETEEEATEVLATVVEDTVAIGAKPGLRCPPVVNM
jgi:hypothetical protein